MTVINAFKPLSDDLDGRSIIESSAGTGKTYTIASLFVRLLVEEELAVGQILVVTFTKAATEELKGRIRQKIRDAVTFLEGGAPIGGDDFLTLYCGGLLEKGREAEAEKARGWLRNALQTFEEAAIFTIHGFCGRVLRDNAFESASLFDTELETDEADLYRGIAADFFRTRIHGGLSRHSTDLIEDPYGYFRKRGLTPDELRKFLRENVGVPFRVVVPPKEEVEGICLTIGNREKEYREAWERAFALWRDGGRDSLRGQMAVPKRMNGGTFKPQTIVRMFDEVEAHSLLAPTLAAFGKNALKFLDLKVNKGFDPPSHPFIEAFRELSVAAVALDAAYGWSVAMVLYEALDFAAKELKERKARRNIRFYDDLLQDLYRAVEGPQRAELKRQVRERYKVALIDEFQDTDLLQYEVFSAFFPEPRTLFLIGDPKQAIYSFRGADIFAYRKAAEGVDEARRFSLGENFRSTPEIVHAVNSLFRRRPSDPFVFDWLSFPEVTASPRGKSREAFTAGVKDESPLTFWFMGRDRFPPSRGEEVAKGCANAEIPEAVASEVVRLLEGGRAGRETVDGRALTSGDVAVLVMTNRQAREVHGALTRRGVPAVIYSAGSVFATREATEVQRVLTAVLFPGDDRKVRAAMATACLGVDGAELERLKTDGPGWASWVGRFAEWRGLWEEDGFVAMARSMMRSASVRRNLLALAGGERRLTNLLHIFELLQDVAHREGVGAEGLVQWLELRRKDANDDEREQRTASEEHQVRLETDEDAVKVVTIHKSKGLEYPVVFCPYLWDVRLPDHRRMEGNDAAPLLGSGVLCHDLSGADPTRTVRDLGSADLARHLQDERRERLSENARVLYVALTRARYRCIVVWGPMTDFRESALCRLLHPACGEKAVPADQELLADLDGLARDSKGTVRTTAMPKATDDRFVPERDEAAEPECRPFKVAIDRTWGVSSFTGLTRGAKAVVETPDRDALALSAPAEASTRLRGRSTDRTPLTFPRGAKAGIFFHKVMETIDFAASDEQVDAVVSANLRTYGFDAEWRQAACAMVRSVLSTPVVPNDPASALSSIGRSDRLQEVEFTLPLDLLTKEALRSVFPGRAVDRLDFPSVQGLMKGAIDMVFRRGGKYHLLDWKTNHLGDSVDDYGPEAMAEEMESALYFLQYHLYSVALDRYLAMRVPGYDYDTHFGGVYYLFVRGMDPARGAARGVFFDRPPATAVSELRDRLFGRS